MNIKKSLSALFIILISFVITANAQEYSTGIGVRAGDASGITAKHFIGSAAAIDGILGFTKDLKSFRITGLYELHVDAFGVSELQWFYGAGAHISTKNNDISTELGIGIDGVVGLEWIIKEIPFSMSMEVKPALELFNKIELNPFSAALSIRYVF
jgi:hypothetical protein